MNTGNRNHARIATVLLLSAACIGSVAAQSDAPVHLMRTSDVTASGGTCTGLTAATAVRRQISSFPGADPTDVFNPAGPKDARLSYSNRGLVDVELHVMRDSDPLPEIRTVRAGSSRTETFYGVLDILVVCPTSGGAGAPCDLDLDILSVPADGGGNPTIWKALYIPPCAQDMEASLPGTPTEPVGCLWESEEVWSFDEAADVQIEFDVTGAQDVEIEVEFADNTFVSHQLYTVAAGPPNWTVVEWDDVIAVRAWCSHSQLSSCASPCEFTYSVCSK